MPGPGKLLPISVVALNKTTQSITFILLLLSFLCRVSGSYLMMILNVGMRLNRLSPYDTLLEIRRLVTTGSLMMKVG